MMQTSSSCEDRENAPQTCREQKLLGRRPQGFQA